ncbi:MAG: terminase large subunit [Rhizobium sp.]
MAIHAASSKFRSGWVTACPDWEDRIIKGLSLVPDLPLFEDEAEKALRVFKRLRVPDVIGNPTYGEACGQWVFDFVRALFGSYDAKARRRMIREFFMLVPKKNGKSSVAAAIMVTAAILNHRPEAELLLIAPTKKIADIAFKQAAGIIRLDPELSKLFHLQQHQRTLTHRISLAVIVIKAADADVITGSKATFILIDETHVFSKKAKAHEVFIEIRGSLAARPDGFLLQITTQSKDPPSGVFKAELDIARQVRDGKMHLPILPVLYELPLRLSRDGGWKKPETWGMVNPNLNRSVDEAFLADEIVKAEHEGIGQLMLIASQHFNVEVGLALMNDRWPGADYWESATDETLTLETLLERSEVVVAGIDGGGLDDLFGLTLIGREKITKRWLMWSRAWAHPDVLERRKDIAADLLDFRKDGDLWVCEEATQDICDVADIIVRVHEVGLLPREAGVGLDAYGVAALVDELASRGLPDELFVAIRQGAALSPATWGMERKLKDGTLVHADQAMMKWCVSNARVEVRGGAVLITKQTAGRAKIDPLVAGFNAGMLMSRNPEAGHGNIDDFVNNMVTVTW